MVTDLVNFRDLVFNSCESHFLRRRSFRSKSGQTSLTISAAASMLVEAGPLAGSGGEDCPAAPEHKQASRRLPQTMRSFQ
jgi:hypothetical protein